MQGSLFSAGKTSLGCRGTICCQRGTAETELPQVTLICTQIDHGYVFSLFIVRSLGLVARESLQEPPDELIDEPHRSRGTDDREDTRARLEAPARPDLTISKSGPLLSATPPRSLKGVTDTMSEPPLRFDLPPSSNTPSTTIPPARSLSRPMSSTAPEVRRRTITST
jgi:hypothetical protein